MGPKNTNQVEPMYTTSEVAKMLNIHINTVRRWSNQGILKSYRIGSRGDRRFLKKDVDIIIKQNFQIEAEA
jgi:excisionase family DNA binding protein